MQTQEEETRHKKANPRRKKKIEKKKIHLSGRFGGLANRVQSKLDVFDQHELKLPKHVAVAAVQLDRRKGSETVG